jgi:hypothetical protein
MLGLEKFIAGAKFRGGGAGPSLTEVVRVGWIASDALNVVYRGSDGPAEVLLFRDAEPQHRGLPAHKIGRLWKFKLSEVDEWVRPGGAGRGDDAPDGERERG